jgi:nitric oxide reductase NorD protein
MSGSTRGWINKAERESLLLLCEALETLATAMPSTASRA